MRLGIDIGGTKINIGVLDKEHHLLGSRKIMVSSITRPADDIKACAHELLQDLKVDPASLKTCGIGVPGTVSSDGRRLLKAPNIGILEEDAADQMEKILGVPVRLIQDSRAAAWGEYLCGAGQGTRTLICMTLGTGIGTGIVINGQIYRGGLGSAGELGHLPVEENGRPCGCGKRGCLEKYCAGGGLDITAAQLLGEGKTSQDLFLAAYEGDQRALDAIHHAVVLLGRAVVGAVNLLSPERVLFSGGLSEQETLFLNPLIEYIRAHCYSSGQLPVLSKAALGENAPLVGAACVWEQPFC